LAFKRQVGERDAEAYAAKNRMAFFEVSPLCDFNIRESFSELSRMALHRNGMERLWRSNKGTINNNTFEFFKPTYDIESPIFVHSAQPARIGLSRDSGSNNGLRYRSIAVAKIDQITFKIVCNDNYISITLQWQPLTKFQQKSGIASSETTIRQGWTL